MNESQLYEQIGRKQSQLETQDVAYSSLLAVLAAVASGEIDRVRVTVDLEQRTWVVAAPMEGKALGDVEHAG
jgi:hypothetical protein